MRTAWTVSHTLFTTIGGIVGWFLGGTDGFLLALVTLVAIDYATGVIAAFATGELSSSVGFKGIARKVMIFALVGLANILDVHVLGEGGVLRTHHDLLLPGQRRHVDRGKRCPYRASRPRQAPRRPGHHHPAPAPGQACLRRATSDGPC